jgi:hypothetical protein
MSVLHLEVCPICGANYGLVRQATRSGGLSQITYVCSECDSVLLWLGDDLWLQGDRWAYQKVGRDDRASLLHASLTVEELRQLANQGPPSGGDEAPVASAWQASENGWEAVPTEEGGPQEPAAGPGQEAAVPGGDAWFEEPPMAPAREAEVSAEYEWLDVQPADLAENDAALTQDDWFQEPSSEPAAGAGIAAQDAWSEPPAGAGREAAVPPEDEWFAEPTAAVAAASAIPVEDQWAGVADMPSGQVRGPAEPIEQASRRRSRGSPLLVVSVVATMLCLFFSAAIMIISTNQNGRTPQGVLPTSPPPGVAASTVTPIPTAMPAPTGPPAVDFQGVTAYVAGTGTHNVVGEVINRSGENLRFVEILASFYDGGGQLVGTGSTFAEMSILEPGGVAPFRLVTLDPPPSLADYKLRSDYLTSSVGPLGLDVIRHSASVAENGWHHIAGEIRNPHDFAVKFPEIVATYYNPSHQVVRVEAVFGQQESLQPGEVSAFEIVLVDPPGDLHHYALQTESVRE